MLEVPEVLFTHADTHLNPQEGLEKVLRGMGIDDVQIIPQPSIGQEAMYLKVVPGKGVDTVVTAKKVLGGWSLGVLGSHEIVTDGKFTTALSKKMSRHISTPFLFESAAVA